MEKVWTRPGMDLRRYGRIAVLPFSDSKGLGSRYASALARGLWSLDFDVVVGRALMETLATLGIRPGDSLSPQDLAELRRMSRADAALIGSVHCPSRGEKRVSVIILDTASGDSVFDMSFVPKRCGKPGDVVEIAESAAQGIRRKVPRRRDYSKERRIFGPGR